VILRLGLGRLEAGRSSRVLVVDRAGDDHVLALLPVGRRRHLCLASSCIESSARRISSKFRRWSSVVEHQLDLLVGPDDEDRRTVMLSAGVRFDGSPETSPGACRTPSLLCSRRRGSSGSWAPYPGLGDVLRPPLVVIDRIDRRPMIFAFRLSTPASSAPCAKLGGADRGEVLRGGRREPPTNCRSLGNRSPLCRLGLEVGCLVAIRIAFLLFESGVRSYHPEWAREPIGRDRRSTHAFFRVVQDYARLSRIVPEVKGGPARRHEGEAVEVTYSLDVKLRLYEFTLRHEPRGPLRIEWQLVRGGDFMRRKPGLLDVRADEVGRDARHLLHRHRAALVPQNFEKALAERLGCPTCSPTSRPAPNSSRGCNFVPLVSPMGMLTEVG